LIFIGNVADAAILDRVAALSDEEVASLLKALLVDYRTRHRDIRGVFRQHYQLALATQKGRPELNEDRRLLAGAYFSNEYSFAGTTTFKARRLLRASLKFWLRNSPSRFDKEVDA
jgi:hypothetical protein